jgi:type IV pilus assembly protein PilB
MTQSQLQQPQNQTEQPAQQVPVGNTPPPQQDDFSQTQVTDERNSIIDILLSQNLLTKQQYEDIKVRSATTGKSAETVLSEMHLFDEEKIARAKAQAIGVPFVVLATTAFSPEALSFIPRAVVERFNVIPFSYDDTSKTLSVAMANPVDLEAVQFVREKTGLTIKAYAAAPSDVEKAISSQYRQELVGEVGKAVKETEELSDKKKVVDSKKIGEIIKEAPIAKIVSTILDYAVLSRASDVHIEPMEDRIRVRYRIDGILYDRLTLPKTVQEAVISRIKILSEMKIDEHRTPQDGRFNFKVEDKEVDLRVSVLPTAHGEKIVMRLLRKSGGIPTLNELGLNGVSLRN